MQLESFSYSSCMARAHEQYPGHRDDRRMQKTDGPSIAVAADFAPDEVTQRDVEDIGARPPKNPRATAPETPGAERKDRPMKRSRQQGCGSPEFESEPDFDVSGFRQKEIPWNQKHNGPCTEHRERGHP